MATRPERLTLIGFDLKIEKSPVGEAITFLVLTSYFPHRPSKMSLAISLPLDKAYRRRKRIAPTPQRESISRATPESLVGRLSFAQTAVCARFARAMLKPLYAELYSKRYFPRLSPALDRNIRWRSGTLIILTSRLSTKSRGGPDWATYANAAFDHGANGARVSALFFRILGGRWAEPGGFTADHNPSRRRGRWRIRYFRDWIYRQSYWPLIRGDISYVVNRPPCTLITTQRPPRSSTATLRP